MTLRALIFDVDGTLAETEQDGHLPAFNTAFAGAGLPWVWPPELYGRLLAVTGGKERIRHFAEGHDPAALGRPDFDALVRQLHTAKTRYYVARVAAGRIPLRPGIARLMDEAEAAGLLLAIATTTTPENVTALLDATLGRGSAARFAVIGAGDAVPAKKPAPDIYLWMLERLGLPAADCLALEDSANGLRAALAAGIPTVVTESAYTRGEDFSGALAVLPDLADTGLAALELMHRIKKS